MDKRAYVRAASQGDGTHLCHWPGCQVRCKPAFWGCYHYWMMLPKSLRDKIWHVFRPGQEEDKNPSRAYVAVAQEVREWILQNYPTSM